MINEQFLARMEAEQTANDIKGPFADWHPDINEARRELQQHTQKLLVIMSAKYPPWERVREYTADLANVAMKLFEDYGKIS